MRKQYIFRPRISENLESRAVPSVAGVATPVGLLGISVTLPSQVPAQSAQVRAAFAAFDQSYIRAVDAVLQSAGPNGLVVPSTRLTAFNAAFEQSLETLAQQLVQSLATSTTGTTTSATTTAASQIVAAIVGDDSTSLKSQLLALPASSTASLAVPNGSTAAGSTASAVPLVVSTAEQVRPPSRVPVAEGVGEAASLAPSTTSSEASDAVRSAFGAFLGDYFKAVQGVLLAPGTDGQINPAANRAAFDSTVDQALKSLESSLSTSLALYPAASGLGPQIKSAIEGDGPSSLKAKLATLATPEAAQAAVVRDFTLGSTRTIAQALALIGGNIANLRNPAGR